MKIDAVITWVDGNDPVHRAKRRRYADPGMLDAVDVAGETRFVEVGEIAWCVASLNRFAPWINRIYIVTDDQDPGLIPFMERSFPQGYIPMEIIDHRVIFRGYEQYLPTFNSISLETMTWRIPGLSDHFIEFNDDLMLTAPVLPEDFFTEDGRVICYGEWSNIQFTQLTRLLKPVRNGRRTVTTKGSHMNGARVAGNRFRYLRLAHCQKALRRDFYERYFTEHPENMVRNISYRFRSADQFTPQAVQYINLNEHDGCVIKSPGNDFFYLMPKKGQEYFDEKLHKLECFNGKFACFNSIDMATEEQRRTLVRWIEKRLDIKIL